MNDKYYMYNHVSSTIGTINKDDEVIPYFKAYELACPTTHNIKIHPMWAIAVVGFRHALDVPLRINSFCRSKTHNDSVGGHVRSLHLINNPVHPTKGALAMDISVDGWNRGAVQNALKLARATGISMGHGYEFDDAGAAWGFLHLDGRTMIGLERHEFFY